MTIPYKKAVVPFCDKLSDMARALGNVNTLCFEPNGRIVGHNTDYAGLLLALRRARFEPQNKKVLILGTGGAAQTAAKAMRAMGARSVALISRSGPDNYQNLERHSDARLLINATPVGMYPDNQSAPVELELFPALEKMFDLIYNPLRTRLLMQAQTLGLRASNGLFMLAAQGCLAAQIFLGRSFSDQCEPVHTALLQHAQNIVLIGMPGCGKSTVGRTVAKLTGRTLVDIDERILLKTGHSPAQIIARDGEQAFRDIESSCLHDAAKGSGLVIATGGGAILREQNRLALRQNGRVYLLERPLDLLQTAGRPLSTDLRALYRARLPHYLAAADVTIQTRDLTERTAQAVVEEFYEHTGA